MRGEGMQLGFTTDPNIVKLNKTIERYASMSRGRHIAGILCYTIYVILTYYILYLIASS